MNQFFCSMNQLQLVEGSEQTSLPGCESRGVVLLALITHTCYIKRTCRVLLMGLSIAWSKRNSCQYWNETGGWNKVHFTSICHPPSTWQHGSLHSTTVSSMFGNLLPYSKGNTLIIKLFKWKLLSWAMTTFLFILIIFFSFQIILVSRLYPLVHYLIYLLRIY